MYFSCHSNSYFLSEVLTSYVGLSEVYVRMYIRMYVRMYKHTYKNLHYGVLLKISRVNLNNKDRHSAPRIGRGSEHKRKRERQQSK